MSRFVRATEPKGKVHWVNLEHVREFSIEPAKDGQPALTNIHIDNWLVERRLTVVETPEQLLADPR
jgi:hypothetical protein